MPAISCCKSPTALSMRVLAPVSTSFTFLNVWAAGAACGVDVGSVFMAVSMNQCTDGFSGRHSHYIAPHRQIEDQDGHLVIPAHGDRGSVHHAQVPRQHLGVPDF